MAKKKGKGGGKKGKKGAKVVKIAPETTKEMVQERELLKVCHRFQMFLANFSTAKKSMSIVRVYVN